MPTVDPVEIPNRSLFRQPEVCEIAKVQPYVLRIVGGGVPGSRRREDRRRPARLSARGRRAGAAAQAPAVCRGADAGRRAPEAERGAARRPGRRRGAHRGGGAARRRRARPDPAREPRPARVVGDAGEGARTAWPGAGGLRAEGRAGRQRRGARSRVRSSDGTAHESGCSAAW